MYGHLKFTIKITVMAVIKVMVLLKSFAMALNFHQGYQQEGWDWNRMPGATTIHLPLKELDSPTHTP